MRSWDRTQIPKPFSTVALVIGEPMRVPEGAADADLEQARLELERRLRTLEERALALANAPNDPNARTIRTP